MTPQKSESESENESSRRQAELDFVLRLVARQTAVASCQGRQGLLLKPH